MTFLTLLAGTWGHYIASIKAPRMPGINFSSKTRAGGFIHFEEYFPSEWLFHRPETYGTEELWTSAFETQLQSCL